MIREAILLSSDNIQVQQVVALPTEIMQNFATSVQKSLQI